MRLVNFGEGPSKADGMGGLFGSTSSSSPKAQQDMAQDISSEPHVAPFWCDYTVEGVDMQRAVVTATGNIVLYGIEVSLFFCGRCPRFAWLGIGS